MNVLGTQNVIAACRGEGVTRLVHTGTPSVVHAGEDVVGVDESAPIATEFLAAYPRTKAAAERAVRAANDERLATVTLRPHLVWGPHDNHVVPRLLARARAGRLRRVGEDAAGRGPVIDATYVENAAEAHLLAADRLEPGAACAGRAYFVANDEPLPLWELVDRIIATAGLPPIERRMSARVAYALGAVCEGVWGLLGLRSEPPMTRWVASQLATSHWYDLSAARRDLGYVPRVATDEGLVRLGEWIRESGA